MFCYDDGTEVQVGDSVLLEHGRTPGVVTSIIVSEAEIKATNVDEPGIMLRSPPFGLVFLPKWSLETDPLQFVSH